MSAQNITYFCIPLWIFNLIFIHVFDMSFFLVEFSLIKQILPLKNVLRCVDIHRSSA